MGISSQRYVSLHTPQDVTILQTTTKRKLIDRRLFQRKNGMKAL